VIQIESLSLAEKFTAYLKSFLGSDVAAVIGYKETFELRVTTFRVLPWSNCVIRVTLQSTYDGRLPTIFCTGACSIELYLLLCNVN